MRTNCRFAMAVHVLTLLAYKDGNSVSSEFLSVSVNTNPVIIRRLLLLLQQAKLVETRKGAKAGSRLSRSAARITLAEVYRAVADAEPFKVPPRKPNGKCPVGHGIRSALKLVFVSAQEALEQDLAKTTLAGIVEQIKVSGLGGAGDGLTGDTGCQKQAGGLSSGHAGNGAGGASDRG